MCTDFYEAMQLEKGTVQRTAQAVAEEMEKDRLYRKLNAHTISLNFNPPVENRIFAVSSPSTDARTGLYCCR